MAAAAASLKSQAEELVESVAVFKMGTSGDPASKTAPEAPQAKNHSAHLTTREISSPQRHQLGYTQGI
jgi:hypothetical protein